MKDWSFADLSASLTLKDRSLADLSFFWLLMDTSLSDFPLLAESCLPKLFLLSLVGPTSALAVARTDVCAAKADVGESPSRGDDLSDEKDDFLSD